MYERFFGLDELPFQLTPDPRYLFLSSKHREALGHLVYGIREGAGFVCVTGEIGAGKTTLLRALLREADESIHYAYVLNPVLTGVELLQEINHELGLPTVGSRRDLLQALNQALLEHKARGQRVVLVIDEAQALDGAILEQLRLLSNFETETAKLLQIVLVGQPELRDLLARPDLEQLNQRITVRWHLGRLDRAETSQYVAHRVRTAGQTRTLFSAGAVSAIHGYSRGIPRLINVACHRALLVAYASDRGKVTRGVVRRALAEIRRHVPARASAPGRTALWAGGAAVAAAAAATLGMVGWQRYSGAPVQQVVVPADSRLAAATGGAAVPGAGVAPAPVAPGLAPAPASASGAMPSGAGPAGVADQAVRGETAEGREPAPGSDGAVAVAPDPALEGQPSPAGEAPAGAAGSQPAESDGVAGEETVAGAAREVQPEQDEIERVMLAEALRQTSAGNSAYEATESLLRAWGAASLSPQESSRPSLDLRSIAASRGLEYLSFSGNLNLLRVLDLPAILEVAPDDGSATRFVTVARLNDDSTTVAVGRSEIAVSPEVLVESWFGKAHLFWRDLDRVGGVLAVGVNSAKVRKLHSLLRSVGVYTGPETDVFGPATEEAVMRFQRAKRLFADGKAGPLTMITLYQSVAGDSVPRLGEKAAAGDGDDPRIGMGGGGRWN